MRHWPFCILIAMCGCTPSQPNPPTSAVAVKVQYPIVAGDVEVTIGDVREIIAPVNSATAGSKWIQHTVTYTNKSNEAIWVAGYSEAELFSGIETRTNDTAEWRDYGLGYCGTGAGEFEIAPNAAFSFTATLPEKYVGEEFRVLVPYRTERAGQHWLQAASQARLVSRPETR